MNTPAEQTAFSKDREKYHLSGEILVTHTESKALYADGRIRRHTICNIYYDTPI